MPTLKKFAGIAVLSKSEENHTLPNHHHTNKSSGIDEVTLTKNNALCHLFFSGTLLAMLASLIEYEQAQLCINNLRC